MTYSQDSPANSVPLDEKAYYKLKLTFANGNSKEISKRYKDPETWWPYWLREIRHQSEIEKLELEITEVQKSIRITDEFYDRFIDEIASCKSFIKEVIVHSKILTPEQQKKLNDILRDKKVTAADRERQEQWGEVGFFIMLGGAYFAGFGIWSIVGLSLVAAMAASAAATLRGYYINKAFNSHVAELKTETVVDSEERAAFKEGMKANNWPRYLTSFTHFCTYRHPLAFAAGMQEAVREKEVPLTKKPENSM